VKFRVTSSDNGQSIEVPNSTLFTGTVVVAVISALTTLLTNLLVESPKVQATLNQQQQTHELAVKKFQVELLERALQSKVAQHRAQSLVLLVDAGLLHMPSATITKLVEKPDGIPEWPSSAQLPVGTQPPTGNMPKQ